MVHYRYAGVWVLAGLLTFHPLLEAANPPKEEKAPSKDKVMWTGTKLSSDSWIEYNFVGGARADFGGGQQGEVSEHYGGIHHIVTRRTLRAFLLRMGVEYEQWNFSAPDAIPVPDELNKLNAVAGFDFRWSRKDMLHFMVRPGLYSEFQNTTGADINTPLEIAYTRIPSNRFQWSIGLSVNTWRNFRYIPGGGFRYMITDRWKLKFFLPTPQIEYRARDDMHLSVGADFRGDSFRMNRGFGDKVGHPELNRALLDYQELRVGAGWSWNIKPLLAFNLQTGYLVSRHYDYHNTAIHNSSGGAPFVAIRLNWLMQHAPTSDEEKEVETPRRALEVPVLRNIFKMPNF